MFVDFFVSQFAIFIAWVALMLTAFGIVRSSYRLRRWWARLDLGGRSLATTGVALVSVFVATAALGAAGMG
jgi:hypothetical protein